MLPRALRQGRRSPPGSRTANSFFVSAQTGEKVALCFRRVLARLCGVPLTTTDIYVAAPVVTAEIVQHPMSHPAIRAPRGGRKARSSICTIS